MQDRGPHLYEFSPSGNCFEYHAMSVGARSQSAKTYLEAHLDEFADCDVQTLVKHGLHALRDTLQQDKELTPANTSVSIVGRLPGEDENSWELDAFKILEGDALQPYLDSMDPKEGANAAPRDTTMETD